MNTKTLSIALIALLVGALGGYLLAGTKTSTPHEAHQDTHHMHEEMDSMMAGLSGKTGDAFDQAFLSEMIVHHEGAVAMAEAALEHAQHEEIKQMAQAIITTQTDEINQMRAWQASWYGE